MAGMGNDPAYCPAYFSADRNVQVVTVAAVQPT